jgi:hypothetical protein
MYLDGLLGEALEHHLGGHALEGAAGPAATRNPAGSLPAQCSPAISCCRA